MNTGHMFKFFCNLNLFDIHKLALTMYTVECTYKNSGTMVGQFCTGRQEVCTVRRAPVELDVLLELTGHWSTLDQHNSNHS